MPKCDICGEEFDTERGLHIHQSQKHDDEAESEEVEEETEEETVEEDSGTEEEAETVEEEDEIVREIEHETEGGLLGGFSRESLVVGGALIGVALGLALGLFLSQSGDIGPSDGVTADQVESKMENLPRANLNISGVTEVNGLFQVNMTTQRGERTIAYFTQDGETMFLNTRLGFQKTTYSALAERLRNPPEPPQNGNQTGTETQNSTAGNQTQ